jgi:hypothetical protein
LHPDGFFAGIERDASHLVLVLPVSLNYSGARFRRLVYAADLSVSIRKRLAITKN